MHGFVKITQTHTRTQLLETFLKNPQQRELRNQNFQLLLLLLWFFQSNGHWLQRCQLFGVSFFRGFSLFVLFFLFTSISPVVFVCSTQESNNNIHIQVSVIVLLLRTLSLTAGSIVVVYWPAIMFVVHSRRILLFLLSHCRHSVWWVLCVWVCMFEKIWNILCDCLIINSILSTRHIHFHKKSHTNNVVKLFFAFHS